MILSTNFQLPKLLILTLPLDIYNHSKSGLIFKFLLPSFNSVLIHHLFFTSIIQFLYFYPQDFASTNFLLTHNFEYNLHFPIKVFFSPILINLIFILDFLFLNFSL